MRLDRFLTLYLFSLLTQRRPARGVRIPILMYHSISDEPETGHPYYWINTSPALFAQQMQFLHDHEYQVISLSAAMDLINQSTDQPISGIGQSTNNQSLDQRAVSQPVNVSTNQPASSCRYAVLTFDDGYRDFLTNAFPVLKGHGFSATVFLPTAFIDNATPGLKGKRHLNWDEVRDLRSEGITFGSHTANHPQLHDLKVEDVEYQVRKSKQIIEEKTGCTVECLAIPYKFPEQDKRFVRMLVDILRQACYRSAVTTRVGSVHSPADTFRLKRLPVNSGDDLLFFRAKLQGGYDWIHQFQNLTKTFRRKKGELAGKPLGGKSA
jgi:hypothetical protein